MIVEKKMGKRRRERKKNLGRIGIEDICFRVDIFRLSLICGLIVYFMMDGSLLKLSLGGQVGIFVIFYVGFYNFPSDVWCDVPVFNFLMYKGYNTISVPLETKRQERHTKHHLGCYKISSRLQQNITKEKRSSQATDRPLWILKITFSTSLAKHILQQRKINILTGRRPA